MSLHTVKMLGILVTTNSKKEILEYIQKYLGQKAKGKRQKAKVGIKPLVIVTPNPEQVVLAKKNERFREILNQADIAIPDGIGLVIASRLLGVSGDKGQGTGIRGRITGIEFMEDLVAVAAKQPVTVGLIGGRGGVAVKALECLRTRFPGLIGWAEEPPEIESDQSDPLRRSSSEASQFTNEYIKEIGEKIQTTNTRIIFVGLGAPKQEFFIEAVSKAESGRLKAESFPLVLMAVGGSFDEISGRLRPAPKFIGVLGLKWLWRLVLEPWRWRRQVALLEFLWLLFKGLVRK